MMHSLRLYKRVAGETDIVAGSYAAFVDIAMLLKADIVGIVL